MPRRGVTAVAALAVAGAGVLALGSLSSSAGIPEPPTSWALAIGNGHLKGTTTEVTARLGADHQALA